MNLDDELRALTTPPPAADPLGKVLARVRRSRHRRASGAVALVAVVAVAIPLSLQSIGHDQRAVPASTVTVPWKLLLAGQSPVIPQTRPSNPAAKPCTPAQLDLSTGSATVTNGTVAVPLTLMNHGPDCQPPGRDGVIASITTADGQEVPARSQISFTDDLRLPGRDLPHGASASSHLLWGNGCGAAEGRWSFSLALPGQAGTFSATVPAGTPIPSCEQPKEKSYISVPDLTVLNAFGQPADDPQKALVQTLTADPTVRINDVLHLTLRLSNPTRGPISLTPCPQLGISFGGHGSAHESTGPPLLMNCAQAPDAVAVGQALDVQLQLPVLASLGGFFRASDGVRPGTYTVSAGIIDEGEVSATVEVLPEGPVTVVDTCAYASVPGASHPFTPPSSDATGLPGQGIISTSRGDLGVAFETRSPCAVNAVLDLASKGFWRNVPATSASSGKFSRVRFDQPQRAGYDFYSELSRSTTYPAGTVLLSGEGGVLSSPDSLEITYAGIPYPPEFTVVGHVTSGLDVIAAVGEAGGERGPDIPVAITGIKALDLPGCGGPSLAPGQTRPCDPSKPPVP